ncbi:hypothetical protein MMC19_006880 [Ptychographa xylographoides]|nr:hypothetical protein [Ptychographa xylographoides]
MGLVRRTADGQGVEWWNPGTKRWCPAVYHDDIRDALLAAMDQQGSYKYPNAHGVGPQPNDRTAFHPDHQNWDSDRENWPPLLYQYKPTPADLSKQPPGYWYTPNGEIILDSGDDPLLNYTELPVAISSCEKPEFLLTYRRSNLTIRTKDLRARMPRYPKGNTGGTADQIRLGTLDMSMTRFRARAGMVSWVKKKGSDSIEAYMDSLLPKHCHESNSIKRFRNLHPYEIAEMHLKNVGQFPERSKGVKDLSIKKKTATIQKEEARVKKLRAKFIAKKGLQVTTQKDSSEEVTTSGDETSSVDTRGRPNKNDFLMREPNTEAHRRFNEILLAPTLDDFRARTGQEPPETDHFASYYEQWSVLQEAVHNLRQQIGWTGPADILLGAISISRAEVEWNVPADQEPELALEIYDLSDEIFGSWDPDADE